MSTKRTFRLSNARRGTTTKTSTSANRIGLLFRRRNLCISFASLLFLVLILSRRSGERLFTESSLETLSRNESSIQEHHEEEVCSFLEQFCSSPGHLFARMASIPAIGGVTTDHVFEASKHAWSPSVKMADKGFSCQAPKTIEFSSHCQNPEIPDCVLQKLGYNTNRKSNYNSLSSSSTRAFTNLQLPHQFVLTQYASRNVWDQIWEFEYAEGPRVTDLQASEWAAKAWWRHNLFTKLLATDTKLVWSKRYVRKSPTPTKEESDRENQLEEHSSWLRLALQRLESMPFFGLMHRLDESFELMGFYMCFPATLPQGSQEEPKEVDPQLEDVVNKHFALDTILLQEAEKLFDGLMQDMRRKKEQGMLCDLSRFLNATGMEIGFTCSK